MASLIFNQLYRIRSGETSSIWRAICSIPSKEESVLVRLPIDLSEASSKKIKVNLRKMRLETRRMTFEQTSCLIESGEMNAIAINFHKYDDAANTETSEAESDGYKLRLTVMKEFVSPTKLSINFELNDDFGGLVSTALTVKVPRTRRGPGAAAVDKAPVSVTRVS